tara:strand:+ start:156662 stop:158467 length:1806 start_codon:yes stop_codon:yes gene_type:complete
MKNIFLLTAILITSFSYAQKTESTVQNHYTMPDAEFTQPKGTVTNVDKAKQYISNHLFKSDDYDLKLLSEIKSLTGYHYSFVQLYKGVEVYQSLIKLNTTNQGEITSLISSFQSIDNVIESEWPTLALAEGLVASNTELKESKHIWINQNGQFIKAISIKEIDHKGYYTEKIYDTQLTPIHAIELTQHLTPVDTTAQGLVYLPDPLTVANTIYGGLYVDNNDQTSTTLDDLRDTVLLNLTFDNGVFSLENEYIKLVENSLPSVLPVTSATPDFYYDRSQSGFEDVNVFYHITNQQEYIRSLGFTNIVDYQIEVDCHGFGGTDNSAFTSGTTPPSIVFGEGGVDDAEDADVIIHEFTHAIMHSTAPNSNFGSERNAMDEAFGDYLAASYSSVFDDFHSDYVFSWDGHNEYWDGRLVTSSAMYPTDLTFNLYGDAPMWSSALMRIERNIGRDLTTKIALESTYDYTSAMTMAQAAQLYITADSNLNNGANYGVICWVFKDKGMINSCSVARPDNLVSVSEQEPSKLFVKVFNSTNFSTGQGNLILQVEEEFNVEIYSIKGTLLNRMKSQNNSLQISPEKFKSGTYIFRVTSKNNVSTFKTIKY